MIYQHNTTEGGRRIADAMNDKIKETGDVGPDDDDGTAGVFVPAG
jgi:hypothetical protein